MARYIDVESLKNDGYSCWHDGKGNVYYEVDHAPTADVVDVVRCRGCMNCEIVTDQFDNDWYFCKKTKDNAEVNPDDFCSYGERKTP